MCFWLLNPHLPPFMDHLRVLYRSLDRACVHASVGHTRAHKHRGNAGARKAKRPSCAVLLTGRESLKGRAY